MALIPIMKYEFALCLDSPSHGQLLPSRMFSLLRLQRVPRRSTLHCRLRQQDLLRQRFPQVRRRLCRSTLFLVKAVQCFPRFCCNNVRFVMVQQFSHVD